MSVQTNINILNTDGTFNRGKCMKSIVFMSHTKLDYDFCNRFDVAAARVGIKVFRSEFEDIKPPAWKTIKSKIDKSSAMFLLIGKELMKAQKMEEQNNEKRKSWKHTQNWIAYEVGLACSKGIDVWVLCDYDVEMNFPVLYLNNYALGINAVGERKGGIGFLRYILGRYNEGYKFPLGWDKKIKAFCPYEDCKIAFNMYSTVPVGYSDKMSHLS